MRLTKSEFVDLIATGDYLAVLKKDDRNRDDIRMKREDGQAAEIQNYPYRINQIPTYIFDEFVREQVLIQDGTDEHGGTVYRAAGTTSAPLTQSA
jgi:hypothetical protein